MQNNNKSITEENLKLAIQLHEQGYEYYNKGSYYEALKLLQDSQKLNHVNPANSYYIASCYLNIGDYDKAIDFYSSAIRIKSDYAPAYQQRANCYRAIKKLDLALQDANKSIELDPNCLYSYYIRSLIHFELENYIEANNDMIISKPCMSDDNQYFIAHEKKVTEALELQKKHFEEGLKVIINLLNNTQNKEYFDKYLPVLFKTRKFEELLNICNESTIGFFEECVIINPVFFNLFVNFKITHAKELFFKLLKMCNAETLNQSIIQVFDSYSVWRLILDLEIPDDLMNSLIDKLSPQAFKIAFSIIDKANQNGFAATVDRLENDQLISLFKKIDNDVYILALAEELAELNINLKGKAEHCLTGFKISKPISNHQKHNIIADNIGNEGKSLENLIEELKFSNPEFEQLYLKIFDDIKIIHEVKFSKIINSDIPIQNWGKNECQKWSSVVKTDSLSVQNNLHETFAVLSRGVEIEYGYKPRDIQILDVLNYVTNNNKGLLQQISTGEGKSLITAIAAIYFALQNIKVDITTSSSVLAIRESQEKIALYNIFNLSVDNNIDKPNYRGEYKKCYDADIVYGDMASFQWDILRVDSNPPFKTSRGDRPFTLIILDEVDNLLIDGLSDMAIIANERPGMTYLNLLLVATWQQLARIHQELSKNSNDINLEYVKELLIKYLHHLITSNEIGCIIPKHLKKFVNSQLETWVESAISAKYQFIMGKNYIVSQDAYGVDVIAPVDYSNTGVIKNNLIWSNGIHQFLQLKHNLELKSESIFTSFISNVGYVKKYNKLFGMTGTLGNEDTRGFLKSVYGVELMNIPTFREKRFKEMEGIATANWLDDIAKSANNEIEKQRAVLIICESINNAKLVFDRYKENFPDSKSRIKLYSRNDNNEAKCVETVAEAGDIIIATNLAARGTDIKTSKIVEENGGLHVCVTYLPKNKRVEDQAFGRTSRQGNSGTAQLIVDIDKDSLELMNHDPNIVKDLKKHRDNIEKNRLKRVREFNLPLLLLKDRLFNEFTKLVSDYRKNNHNNEQLIAEVSDYWGFWLKGWELRIHKDKNFEEKEIIEDFEILKSSINDILLNNNYNNPYELIHHGNESYDCDDRTDAIKDYTKAINLDENVSAQAYYNRAFAYISTRVQDYRQKAIDDLISAKKCLSDKNIMQLNVMQLLINLNPEQSESYSPLISGLQSKIDFYKFQIQHIDEIINLIQTIPEELKIYNTNLLEKAIKDFNLSLPQQSEIIDTGLKYFVGVRPEYKPKKRGLFGAICVAALGVLQIVAGVAVTVASMGAALPIGSALISEGIGDLVFAAKAILSGHFSWSEYEATKITSVAVSVITMGIDIIKAAQANNLTKAASKEISKSQWKSIAIKQVKQGLIQAGVGEVINLGINYISKESLKGLKSDIRDSVKSKINEIFNQQDNKIILNKIFYANESSNGEVLSHIMQILNSIIKSKSSIGRCAGNVILTSVVDKYHSGLGAILKIANITDALAVILYLTEKSCNEFIDAIRLISLRIPATEKDYAIERNNLASQMANELSNLILNALHKEVINPSINLALKDKIRSIADKIYNVTFNMQPLVEEIKRDFDNLPISKADLGISASSDVIDEESNNNLLDWYYLASSEETDIPRSLVLSEDCSDKDSLWGKATCYWDDFNMTERSLGALQGVGGVLQVGAGLAIAETGVGALTGAGMATLGVDNAVTGFKTMWSGTYEPTQTNYGLQGLGLNQNLADVVELSLNAAPLAKPVLSHLANNPIIQDVRTSISIRKGNFFQDPVVFHSKTSLAAAESVYAFIDKSRFNPNSRFGAAFYVAEHGPTTINELAHHGAVAKHSIRYKLNLKESRILDLTQPTIAKNAGYLGGNNYAIPQRIAEKAKFSGFNIIRYSAERGKGANLAVIDDFEKILKPEKIIEVPNKQPRRFYNHWKK